jgi:hypothetical protein
MKPSPRRVLKRMIPQTAGRVKRREDDNLCGNYSALTPDPSPTLRERGEPAPADFSLKTPLSRSVGEGSGVRAA